MKTFRLSDSLKRELALAAKIILILSLFFLSLEFAQPHYFLWDDNASFFLPCYDLCYKSLINEHCIPWMLWNHNLGQTFLTKLQEGFFYPPIYLMSWLSRSFTGDIFWTIDLLAIFHFIVAGLGISAYLKKFNFSDCYRIAGAFLYATVPFGILLTKSWIVSAYAICMIPWALIAVEKIGKEKGLLSIFPFIFVQSFFFLNGYVQFWFQANLILLSYIFLRVVYRDEWSLRVAIPKLVVSSMISLLLLYPLILLGLEAKNDSFERSASFSLSYLSGYSVNFIEYIYTQFGVFSPYAFANTSSMMYWNGMLVALIISAAIPILKNIKMQPLTKLFFLLSLFVLLLSIVLFVFLYWIPPFNTFRFPFRWILFLPVFLVPLFLHVTREITTNKKNIGLSVLIFISFWNLTVYFHSEAWIGFTKMHLEKRSDLDVSWWDKNYRCVHVTEDWSDVYISNLRAHLLPALIERISYFGCDVLLSRLNYEVVSPFGIGTIHSMPIQELNNQLKTMEKWSGRYLMTFPQKNNLEAIENLKDYKKIEERDGVSIFENTTVLPLIYFDQDKLPVRWMIKKNRLFIYPENRYGKIHIQFLSIPNLFISIDGDDSQSIPSSKEPIQWDIPPGAQQIELFYKNDNLEKHFKIMGYCWIFFLFSWAAIKVCDIKKRN